MQVRRKVREYRDRSASGDTNDINGLEARNMDQNGRRRTRKVDREGGVSQKCKTQEVQA